MKNVILFNEITTEEALQAIESEALSYEGLHVEMSDPEQRKFVKGKLSDLTSIVKKINRARIDRAKEHKTALDKEACEIKKRIEVASKPFSDLLDEWSAERKVIINHKKQQEAERQKEMDHENAIMENKLRDIEKKDYQTHVIATCKAAKESLIQHANLTEAQAVSTVKAIRSGLISSVNINF